ncbi:HAD family hydrolase [Oceanobacillus bengalensis]|uniref:HAD family hydrolase n=1 Tax=Oceanobacillus bengalensis TaxID=1435466 RepID=A0A494Z5B5_9BACI|nr:HAD family hydrolase [Oceanobacillus bengalensis]RKQ17194.1 HAD family hydrolase [Oceanobacillus bengalensis]
MKKAVLFDLDGTLLNRDKSLEVFIADQYERLNKWLGHIPKGTYISRFIKLDNHGLIWKDKVYQQLVDEFNLRPLTWEFLLEDYLTRFNNNCIPFPNVSSILEQLKTENFLLGMITNGKGSFQMDNIKALGIENYFDTILISDWEGMKKPDTVIFKRALEGLNVSPKESIFVGDHPENDILAAQNIGMTGIWKRNFQWTMSGADYIIDDLIEVPLIVRKLNEG